MPTATHAVVAHDIAGELHSPPRQTEEADSLLNRPKVGL
jgi:hypothetical protein